MEPKPSNNGSQAQASADDSFDSSKYIKADAYEAAIKVINDRLDAIETRTKDHAALAISFKEAFEHDKDFDKVLVELICRIIKTNDDVKKSVTTAVDKSDRDALKAFMKRVGWAVWSLFLAIAAFLAGKFL